MKYIVTLNDKTYEVEVEKGTATVVKTAAEKANGAASGNGSVAENGNNGASAPAAAPVAAPAATATGPSVDGEKIEAPLPGTILAVKKKAGEAVKRGEVLFILEAMKMENEIFAPRDGVMGEVFVSAGAAVNMGDVLAVIK